MLKKMILWASLLTVMVIAQPTSENAIPKEKNWDIHGTFGILSVKGISTDVDMVNAYFVGAGYSYSFNINQWWHFVPGLDLLIYAGSAQSRLISEIPLAFYLRNGNSGFYMPLGITLSDYSDDGFDYYLLLGAGYTFKHIGFEVKMAGPTGGRFSCGLTFRV
jgi:hypothetical protein